MMSDESKQTFERGEGVTPTTDVLTSDEVAHWLKIDERTVQRMAQRGELPARKVGRSWRFLTEEILRWMKGEDNDSGIDQ